MQQQIQQHIQQHIQRTSQQQNQAAKDFLSIFKINAFADGTPCQFKELDFGELLQVINALTHVISMEQCQFAYGLPEVKKYIDQTNIQLDYDMQVAESKKKGSTVIPKRLETIQPPNVFTVAQFSWVKDKLNLPQQTYIRYLEKSCQVKLERQIAERGHSPFLLFDPTIIYTAIDQPMTIESKLILYWFFWKEFLTKPASLRSATADEKIAEHRQPAAEQRGPAERSEATFIPLKTIAENLFFVINDYGIMSAAEYMPNLRRMYEVLRNVEKEEDQHYWVSYMDELKLQYTWIIEQMIRPGPFGTISISGKTNVKKLIDSVFDELSKYQTLIACIYLRIIYFVLTMMDMQRYQIENVVDMNPSVVQSIISDEFDPMRFSYFRAMKKFQKEDEMQECVNEYNKFLQNIHAWDHLRTYQYMQGKRAGVKK